MWRGTARCGSVRPGTVRQGMVRQGMGYTVNYDYIGKTK